MEAHATHIGPLGIRRPSWATGVRVLLGAVGAVALYRVLRPRARVPTVRGVDDLRLLAGVEVIATIPAFGGRTSSRARPRPDAAALEAYRGLRARLRSGSPAAGARVVVITSARSGDGKTTSAANLAGVMAQAGDRVLLIDAETRRGDQHAVFGVPAEPGFFDLLFEQAGEDECIRSIRVPNGAAIDLLPSGGASQANAEEFLMAGGVPAFIERLRPRYDVILIDSPPLESFADAARLGAHADAVVLVARAGRTPRRSVQGAMRQLRHARATVAGAVLNDVAPRR
jgi:capsular exopolysaccharide synthesis family protein